MFSLMLGRSLPFPAARVRRELATAALLVAGALTAGAAGASAQSPPAGGQPPAESRPPAPAWVAFDPPSIDFGQVWYGAEMKHKAKLTNVSGADLAIAEIKTSCGCTLAKVHKKDGTEVVVKAHPPGAPPTEPFVTLAPDESLDIDVELQPPASMKARIEKFVQVLFMDKQHPMEQLPVRAQIGLAYSVEPDFVNVGIVRKSGVLQTTIKVTANVEGDWEITGFKSGDEGQELPAGMKFEVLDHEGKTRRVTMSWDGPRPVGSATNKVHILIDGPGVGWAEFATWGTVMSDIEFDNNDPRGQGPINFDTIEKGSKATRTLTITNRDPSVPYVIESVEVQSSKPQYFTTNVRTLQEGVSYAVDITCDSGIADPFFSGQIVVKAKHPEEPIKKVNFSGRVGQG
jgi:hypothetical protein